MRVTLIALLLPATLTFSSVIPSKFIQTWKNNAVIRSVVGADYASQYGEVVKRMSGGLCRGVKIKEGICPRDALPQRITMDPTPPAPDCFRDVICCGDGCNGLNIVGPAKRDLMPEQSDNTIMAEPNMKPLVKRQDSLPQAGQQVVIYQNGQLTDQKYAGLFTCKLPSGPPPSPPAPPSPAPTAVRETLFHIGYFQDVLNEEDGYPPGFYLIQYKAAIFANNSPGVDEKIACNDAPTYRDQDFTTGERPKYPQKIRFDSAGRKGCEFNRINDGDAGGLTCDGIIAKCKKVPGDPERVDCKDAKGKPTDPWRTQVTCTF